MAMNSNLYDEILSNEYVKINNGVTYYNGGTQRAISSGTYKVSLSTNYSATNSFTYTSVNQSNVGMAYYMKDLLATANTHLNDNKFGLYYHEYYAYSGTTITLDDFTYTNKNVYRLDIGQDGKFHFTQSSNTNARTYEELTSYNSIVSEVQSIDSSYLGNIYYYSGGASQGDTQGTKLFYEVRYNESSKAYELKKFGVIDHKYDICTSGDFSNTTTINTYATPSLNSNELGIITNLMKYMDSTLFTSGSITTNYTYGIGGSNKAVISARVTVNNVIYIRKYLITVKG